MTKATRGGKPRRSGGARPVRQSNPIRARFLATLAILLTLFASAAPTAADPRGPLATGFVERDDRFGIAHISYPSGPRSAERYSRAAEAGARWNRWALYWTDVERVQGQYDWSAVDAAIDQDRASGFRTNPVLLATPSFYSTSLTAQSVTAPRLEDKTPALAVMRGQPVRRAASSAISPPRGLYEPIFADGTDTASPGKAINPANPWARFVAAAVERYRDRVDVWEIWNEPDFSVFWSGSIEDYVRLLKVASISARSVDSSVTILLGGMMYWEWTNRFGRDHAWLRAFLDVVSRDPSAAPNGFFFDGIPWHWYSRPSDVYDKLASARAILSARGVGSKTMWVNEANAPACGEPPANVSCSDTNYRGSATVAEQSAFVIQYFAYALAADVAGALMFQYADDGVGEAFGLFRNDGSARPAYTAYSVAARYFGDATKATRQTNGRVEKIVVETTRGRTTALWARGGSSESSTVDAASASALLVSPSGASWTIFPTNGQYVVALAGATNNRGFGGDPADYIIGGEPLLLVEEAPSYDVPVLPTTWVRTVLPVIAQRGPIQ